MITSIQNINSIFRRHHYYHYYNQHFAIKHLVSLHSDSDFVLVSPALTLPMPLQDMSSYDNKSVLDASMEDISEDLFGLYGSDQEGDAGMEEESRDELETLTIGGHDLFSPTQLVEEVGKPSQGSARVDSSSSSEESSWAKEMEEEKSDPASQQGVHVGLGDQGLHHASVEVPPVGASGDGVELAPPHPELRDRDWAREARRKASFLAAQRSFLGQSSGPQPPNTMELESVATLRGWYLPVAGGVWQEGEVFRKLEKLRLVPEQQAVLDNGLQAEQWQLPRDQASQPHNELLR